MKFIYQGEYREFRGHVFKWGKPTTVNDRATIEACLKDASFKTFDDVEIEQALTDASPAPLKDMCPKCGRIIKQGRYMHVKHCKGAK